MVPYADKVVYTEEVYEAAWRGGSVELNHSSNRVHAARVYENGCFAVASSTTRGPDELLEEARRLARRCVGETGWVEGSYYRGSFRSGVWEDPLSLVEIVESIAREVSSQGARVEVIGVARRALKEFEVLETGSTASEERIVYELYVYPYTVYMGRAVSTGFMYVANRIRDLWDRARGVAEESRVALSSIARARRLNPAYSGRWFTVLSGDSAPAFYHEIAHLLQGDEPVRLARGMRLSSELTMVEDPFAMGPLQRVFDDELYPAWRRRLIDGGVVVDYLYTRTCCGNGDCRPGNARGVFTRAKALHHQLIVHKGSWSFDEMIVESRRSIVVSKIVRAEILGDYIRVIPEIAWVAEKDRLTPAKVMEVLIPVSRLGEAIVGVGRRAHERTGFEKGMLVYEEAPDTLVEARVT